MTVREYRFNVSVETADLPTSGTPTDPADLATKAYVDGAFMTMTPYTKTFNATSDWGTASGGYYTIAVAAVTHGKGTIPTSDLQQLTGADFYPVVPDRMLITAAGQVEVRVLESPDCRFAGRLVIK